MPRSPIRLQCPNCRQKLRLVNVAAGKDPIHCPNCNASIPLYRRQSRDIPLQDRPLPARGRVVFQTDSEEEEDQYAPPYKAQYRSRFEWTPGKILRVAFGVLFAMPALILAFHSFFHLLALISHPSIREGLQFGVPIPGIMFFVGISLGLLNLNDDAATRESGSALAQTGGTIAVIIFVIWLGVAWVGVPNIKTLAPDVLKENRAGREEARDKAPLKEGVPQDNFQRPAFPDLNKEPRRLDNSTNKRDEIWD